MQRPRQATGAFELRIERSSHHQGIGLLKVPFMVGELGEQEVGALAAVKRGLDPGGVLNPGKLIPS